MSDRLLLHRRVFRFLRSESLAVIATCGNDMKPRASVVAYALQEDFTFWFATRRQTRKFEDLRDNPEIGIVVGHDYSPWTVQMSGQAKLCSDKLVSEFFGNGTSRARLRALLTGGGYPSLPFSSIPGIDIALFRVRITEVQAMDLDPKTGKARFRRFAP